MSHLLELGDLVYQRLTNNHFFNIHYKIYKSYLWVKRSEERKLCTIIGKKSKSNYIQISNQTVDVKNDNLTDNWEQILRS